LSISISCVVHLSNFVKKCNDDDDDDDDNTDDRQHEWAVDDKQTQKGYI